MHAGKERVIDAVERDGLAHGGVDDLRMAEDFGWMTAQRRGLVEAPELLRG